MVTKKEIDGSNIMNSLPNKVFNVLYLENFSINQRTNFLNYYFKFRLIYCHIYEDFAYLKCMRT